jgi:glycosyltransferase involved in cell wall biosynthesis
MLSPPDGCPLLLHVFPTFATGGAQVRFCAIANHFGRRWRHAVIAMNGDLACRERLGSGLDVSFPQVDIRKGDALGNFRRFRAVLRDLRPHLLVTSNWGTIEWALANAPPLLPSVCRHVHMEDGFGPEECDRQLPRRVRMRRLALRHSLIMLPSQTLLRIATQQWRFDARRLRYVPNGIDLARFVPVDRTARDGPMVVGTVATLRPEKNLGRLLRAFARASEGGTARLAVVGSGPERGTLEAQAQSLGIGNRVMFAGHRMDAEHVYREMDLFALSSDTEQMPLSVLEAMASGLPLVSTDVGDVSAMVAEPNRPFVVPAEDGALAEALRAMLADAALRARLGAANRARAEHEYSQNAMFEAYASMFDPPHVVSADVPGDAAMVPASVRSAQ